MTMIPRRELDSIRIADLEPEHIESISAILDSLNLDAELHPDATLSSLVELWLSEQSKGESANKDAMHQIENVVISAQTLHPPLRHHDAVIRGSSITTSHFHKAMDDDVAKNLLTTTGTRADVRSKRFEAKEHRINSDLIEKMPAMALHGTTYRRAAIIAKTGPIGDFFYVALPPKKLLKEAPEPETALSQSISTSVNFCSRFPDASPGNFFSRFPNYSGSRLSKFLTKYQAVVVIANWEPEGRFITSRNLVTPGSFPFEDKKMNYSEGYIEIGHEKGIPRKFVRGIAHLSKEEIKEINRRAGPHDYVNQLLQDALITKTNQVIKKIIEDGPNGGLVEM